MTRLLITFALFLCVVSAAQSQAVRRFHQDFNLDQASAILFDVDGEIEVVTWPGSNILVEAHISTDNGSTAILNFLQKEGRFDLAIENNNGVVTVVSKLKNHQPIKVKGVDMQEKRKYLISVPDSFMHNSGTDKAFTKAKK